MQDILQVSTASSLVFHSSIFVLAPGGITKPKLVKCVDSSGVEHKQLVKGGADDMRQDAVMEQFFGLVTQVGSSVFEPQHSTSLLCEGCVQSSVQARESILPRVRPDYSVNFSQYTSAWRIKMQVLAASCTVSQ